MISLELRLTDAHFDSSLIAIRGPHAEDRNAAQVALTVGDAAGDHPARSSRKNVGVVREEDRMTG